MKLVKNPITVDDRACRLWGEEAVTEIAECLVAHHYVLSLNAVRFHEPAPDQLFYAVCLQRTDDEILLIADFDEQDYGPVCDAACFDTLNAALACFRDTIYSLSHDIKL